MRTGPRIVSAMTAIALVALGVVAVFIWHYSKLLPDAVVIPLEGAVASPDGTFVVREERVDRGAMPSSLRLVLECTSTGSSHTIATADDSADVGIRWQGSRCVVLRARPRDSLRARASALLEGVSIRIAIEALEDTNDPEEPNPE